MVNVILGVLCPLKDDNWKGFPMREREIELHVGLWIAKLYIIIIIRDRRTVFFIISKEFRLNYNRNSHEWYRKCSELNQSLVATIRMARTRMILSWCVNVKPKKWQGLATINEMKPDQVQINWMHRSLNFGCIETNADESCIVYDIRTVCRLCSILINKWTKSVCMCNCV